MSMSPSPRAISWSRLRGSAIASGCCGVRRSGTRAQALRCSTRRCLRSTLSPSRSTSRQRNRSRNMAVIKGPKRRAGGEPLCSHRESAGANSREVHFGDGLLADPREPREGRGQKTIERARSTQSAEGRLRSTAEGLWRVPARLRAPVPLPGGAGFVEVTRAANFFFRPRLRPVCFLGFIRSTVGSLIAADGSRGNAFQLLPWTYFVKARQTSPVTRQCAEFAHEVQGALAKVSVLQT